MLEMERGAKMPLRMPEKVYLENDYEAMSRRSAELVCDVVRKKPDALVSLPAGSTAKRTFEIMCEMAKAGEVDFSKTRFVALDEWLDLEDESEDCNGFMCKHFYGPAGIPDEHITRFDIHAKDLDAACKAVDEVVFANGGIDVMLLLCVCNYSSEEAMFEVPAEFEGAKCLIANMKREEISGSMILTPYECFVLYRHEKGKKGYLSR